MVSDSGIFRIAQDGGLPVVSFGDDGPPNHFYHDECITDLTSLVESNGYKQLAFDLTGVEHIASGMIGIFTWLARRGVSVELRNTSSHIRKALEALKLTNLFVAA